ncbi:hypothetical protein [Arthrobacter globiformis]|uniref:hypothetical protein n=1 Tax=Arthrobacter globiformis TaxID=1665 RepID=UPI0027891512|nr:hypothetical protein [Arthrobacter globiformis]MDQ0866492.1 hypothetical protein [Arthrobacter globiformis]
MNLLEKLDQEGISTGMVVDSTTSAFLRALPAPATLTVPSTVTVSTPQAMPAVLGSTFTGPVTISAAASPGSAQATVKLKLDGLALSLPSAVRAATRTVTASGQRRRIRYADAGGPASVTATGTISIILAQSHSPVVDVSQLSLSPQPRTVLLPGNIGLTLPATFTAEGGSFKMVGTEFVLPESVPVVGGVACEADLECGKGPLNLDLTIQPALVTDGQNAPAIGGTLSWHLPNAESFDQLVPTAVSLTLDLPTGDGLLGAGGPTVSTPLRVRAGMSRPPEDPGALHVTVTMESDAPSGLLSVFDASPGAIAAGITTAIAPAILADSPTAATGALFATAALVGRELAVKGGFTLHAVTLDASVEGSSTVNALLDVEGLVTADLWRSGPLAVGMRPGARPLRVRWRDVAAAVDPAADVGEMLTLDFSRSRVEVVDPGEWTIDTPGSLLDIVGTRSGHGSTWFEVDLRFVVELGPITISGATVRATFENGDVSLGLRGLIAGVEVPGLISGEGQVSFTPGGFAVVLGVEVPPVGLAALGFLRYDDLPQGRKTELGFAVDLPGPIPLGPTGLGLYGVLGTFGYNARMPALDAANPFLSLRKWKPWVPLDFGPGNMTIGIGVSIGTAPDNGFFFSSLGVLGLTVPAFDLRVGLDGNLLAKRKTLTRSILDKLKDRADHPPPAELAISVFGGVAATTDALDIAVAGKFTIDYLVAVDVPLAAHFPFRGANWWIRNGSDDGIMAPTNRPPGPIRARVLPKTPFECGGWAFLMVHGAGINAPSLMGDPAIPATTGFTIGLGAGIEVVIGAKGILWAEITARLTALISTRPRLVRITANVSGTLGIGPFHIGLSAEVTLQVWSDRQGDILYAYKLQVCGEIDLFFDTLRKCITINTLDAAPAPLAPAPAPEDWPWPDVFLADGLGRSLPAADGAAGSQQRPASGSGPVPDGGWAKAPVVWPDVVPILAFPIAPAVGTANITSPAPSINLGLVSSGGATITWTLQDVVLEDVTNPGAITSIPLYDTSRWQPPADTGTWPAGTSNTRELVLLRRTLLAWAAHIAGDGSHLKPMMDPGQLIGGACLWSASEGPGWAVGRDATPLDTADWHVPAEHSGWDARTLLTFANGTGFTVRTVPVLPMGAPSQLPPATIPAGPAGLSSEATADGRRFASAFRLTGSVFIVREPFLWMRTSVTLDEPVVDGRLHLLLAMNDGENPYDFYAGTASARTKGGTTVAVSVEPGDKTPDGSGVVVTLALPPSPDDPIAVIDFELSWGQPAYILGLIATTGKDHAAAMRGRDAQKASNNADAAGSAVPAKLSKLLTPGHRYRISATLGWESALNVAGINAAPDSSGPGPFTQSWYFATAGRDPNPPAKPATPQQATQLVKAGTASGYSSKWKLVESAAPAFTATGARIEAHLATAVLLDTFKPGYLARYVKGFTPADHTEYLFPADRPGIEFLAMHIVELAGLYSRDVGLLVRRVDKAAPDIYAVPVPQPAKSKPKLALASAVAMAAKNAGCPVPPTESALTLPQDLQMGASYELSCVLPEAGNLHPGKWTPSIGGITFTTSNYTGPADLLHSFGFASGGSGAAHGDLAVVPVTTAAGHVQDDAELERLVDALGLPPLRPVRANRSSLLWALAGGRWALAGLLLESTEPFIRDESRRMGLRDAKLSGTELPVRVVNRASTTALWLATTPLNVSSPVSLVVRATDRLTDFTCGVTVTAPPRFTSAILTAVEDQ